MEGFTGILLILLSSILVNNFVLSRILGICPFIGVSKRVETAVGMGLAVTFVMALASVIAGRRRHLDPLTSLLRPSRYTGDERAVQLGEMALQKMVPSRIRRGHPPPPLQLDCLLCWACYANIKTKGR